MAYFGRGRKRTLGIGICIGIGICKNGVAQPSFASEAIFAGQGVLWQETDVIWKSSLQY